METIVKPWGKEELLEKNSNYVMKRLTMHKGFRCSLQYHEIKCETIYVLSGELNIQHGDDCNNLKSVIMTSGDSLTIKTGIIHRMSAITDSVYLEASTPELDDVIRVEDDFNRN